MAWLSKRPVGRRGRGAPRSTHASARSRRARTCRPTRWRRTARRRAPGSPGAGCRRGRRARRRGTRSRARTACSRLIVMPTTRAWWWRAACNASEPQPQPTSRSRRPGCLVQPELPADQLVLVGLGLGQAHLGIARTARTSRSSPGRARCRRTRCRRRSGGSRPGGRGAASGGGRGAASPRAGAEAAGRRRRGAAAARQAVQQRPRHEPEVAVRGCRRGRGARRGGRRPPRGRPPRRRGPTPSWVGRPEDLAQGSAGDPQRARPVDGTHGAAVPRLDADRGGIAGIAAASGRRVWATVPGSGSVRTCRSPVRSPGDRASAGRARSLVRRVPAGGGEWRGPCGRPP